LYTARTGLQSGHSFKRKENKKVDLIEKSLIHWRFI